MVARVSRRLSVLGFQLRPVADDPAATLAKFEDHVKKRAARLGYEPDGQNRASDG